MTKNDAILAATVLWKKWVSLRPAVGHNGYLQQSDSMEDYRFYDLPKLHEVILHEYRWHRTGKSTATPSLQREVRGELILLGKIRKALAA
jgi:hypothetical protein